MVGREPDDERAKGLAAGDRTSSAGQPEPTPESSTIGSPGSLVGHEPVGIPFTPDSFVGYQIIKEVHRGGQGVVYQAIQRSTKRRVAIKALRKGPFASPAERARFEREVEILGQLKHPNIVTIHDSGVVADCHYFVMDYISGQSLDTHVQTARLSIEQTLRLLANICEAVNAAHLRGIVHRDLKPGNIRIDTEGEPHILDFGLAKVMAGASSEAGLEVMTATGQFMGSLPWASPEQAEAVPSRIDARSDVYSLGVILYQMLTGRFPYDVTGNLRAALQNILTAEPVRPSTIRGDIGAEVETIVLKCLHKDRDRRYQNAGEVARDIGHYLAGEPIEARRDSIAYVLRTRTATGIRRHPAFTCVLIAVLATLLAQTLGVALVYRWTPVRRAFDRLVSWGLRAATVGAPFADVRVVALRDRTDLPALAAQAGLAPEALASDPQYLRRLHGSLMTRLAAAGARVVAWDVAFKRGSVHDADFAAGVRTLRDAGGEAVVALDVWSLAPEVGPALSTAIAAGSRWGCTPAGLAPNAPWHVYLAVQRGMGEPLPSLAVAAFAARHHPGAAWDLRLGRVDQTLTIVYGQRAAGASYFERLLGESDVVGVSAVQPAERDNPTYGLRQDDLIAYYLIDMPADAVLSAATLDYGDVFAADPAELRRSVGGRIVVVGDERGGGRTYVTPAGRRIWGTYAHATAIDELLREAAVSIVSTQPSAATTACGALLGLAIGWWVYRRRGARGLALLAGCVLFVALSVLLARFGRTLYNPLVAVVALAVACEAGAAVRGMSGLRRT
jgi:tRNA A-37 threonylcarbamoyl transferase component Bud32/CHASE2 domain-containing sensor protein